MSTTGQEESRGVRTFVCLRLPGDLVEGVRLLQRELKRRLGERGIRWSHPDQWHLTLRFLGTVAAADIPPLTRALEEVGRHAQPFTLRLGGLGCFPGAARPRVLWLGVGGDTQRLADLQRAVAEKTAPWGDPEDARGFAPHLTLARFRPEARCEEALGRVLATERAEIAGAWPVTSLALMESELLAGGARHSVLEVVPLGEPLPPVEEPLA